MMRQQDEDMLDKELDFKREMMDRQAVASGNVDENSALYRHAKLNGWAIGKKNDPYSGAGRKWLGGGGGGGDGAAAPRLSGFGANMDTGRATRYYDDGSQQTVQNGTPAQHMFAQMGDLIQQGNAARQRKRGMDDAALASGLVYAKQNGGFIPRDILQAMSAQLGTEIAGGNYTSDGNFVLYGKQQVASPNGRVRGEQFVPIAIADRDMQMRVLQRSGLGQDLQKEIWDTMTGSGKLTPQQVMDRGHKNPYADEIAAAERADKWLFEQNEKRRQFDEKMRLERDKLSANGGGGGKYDKDYYAALAGRAKAFLNRREISDLSDEEKAQYKAYVKEADDYLSGFRPGGSTSAATQGGQQEIATDSKGNRWIIIRDANGKAVGRSPAPAQPQDGGQTSPATATTAMSAETDEQGLDEDGNRPDTEDLPAPKPMTEDEKRAEAEEWAGHNTPEMSAEKAASAATNKSQSESVRDEMRRSGKLGGKKPAAEQPAESAPSAEIQNTNEQKARGLKDGKYEDERREARFQEFLKKFRKHEQAMRYTKPLSEDEVRKRFEDKERDDEEDRMEQAQSEHARQEFTKKESQKYADLIARGRSRVSKQ